MEPITCSYFSRSVHADSRAGILRRLVVRAVWSETGTHHLPGIQPADVEELLAHGCRTVVLSRGMLLRLPPAPETLEFLERRRVQVHVAESREAAQNVFYDSAGYGSGSTKYALQGTGIRAMTITEVSVPARACAT
jgi:hypothetical protein